MPPDRGLGSADPGVGRLFRTLTAAPESGELAGEQQALAMFLANRPPAQPAAGPARPALAPVRRARWRFLLAGAAALALVVGAAVAAYTASLPAPVQNFAYRELGFLGVPAVQHGKSRPGPAGPGRSVPPGGQHRRSATRRAPALAGRRPAELLSAIASAGNITAGNAATIDGRLTKAGKAVAGATVTLLERPAGQPRWHAVGTGQTDSSGNVAVGVTALVTNAAFRLDGPDGAGSPVVRITVSPPVTIDLKPGARAIRDVLIVTTQYARPGDIVVLQVRSASGNWANLRGGTLGANGQAQFVLDGASLTDKKVRVVLLRTTRHAASASNLVTVPPPS